MKSSTQPPELVMLEYVFKGSINMSLVTHIENISGKEPNHFAVRLHFSDGTTPIVLESTHRSKLEHQKELKKFIEKYVAT